jgi:peptidoglycan/LPS O-acetylase OafA/YrhL
VKPRIVGRPMFGWAAVAGCLGLILAASHFARYPHLAWEAPGIALASAALIWHLNSGTTPLRRFLGRKPFAYIGRRSYGIYLYHYPILEILAAHSHARRIERSGLMLIITIVVAITSYRFIELPFLRLKDRRSPEPAALGVPRQPGTHRVGLIK